MYKVPIQLECNHGIKVFQLGQSNKPTHWPEQHSSIQIQASLPSANHRSDRAGSSSRRDPVDPATEGERAADKADDRFILRRLMMKDLEDIIH